MVLKVIERERRHVEVNNNKVQVQIKNKSYSRSLTIHGTKVDYVYNMIHMMFKELARSELNEIKLVCYKPPTQEGEINVIHAT